MKKLKDRILKDVNEYLRCSLGNVYNKEISTEIEKIVDKHFENDISLMSIDKDVLEYCVDLHRSGDKLTAIKYLLEEVRLDRYTFNIKWASELLNSKSNEPK